MFQINDPITHGGRRGKVITKPSRPGADLFIVLFADGRAELLPAAAMQPAADVGELWQPALFDGVTMA